MILSFDTICREFFDYSDKDTLHMISEAEKSTNSNKVQNQILIALTSRLYELIQEKADKIDYSSVAMSRGDITKINKYDQLVECLDIMKKIVISYNQDTKPVDTVFTAIENLKSRKDVFTRGFVINSPIVKLTYNNIAMAIVNSVGFLINTTIEYVKNPGSETFGFALNTVAYNKAFDALLFENLEAFNEGCASGEIDKALAVGNIGTNLRREAVEIKPDTSIDHPYEDDEDKTVVHDCDKKVVKESIGLYIGVASIIAICKVLIPIIRSLVYFFYNTKQKISDFWIINADLLTINAYNLQVNDTNGTRTPAETKKIVDRQLKLAEKWRRRGQKLDIDTKIATRNTNNMISKETRQFVKDEVPYTDTNVNGDIDISNTSIF